MKIGYKHLFERRKRSDIVVIVIIMSLALYFLASLYFLPKLYIRIPKLRPAPIINSVRMSPLQIYLGQTFDLSVAAENLGDNADIQIVSMAFPNLTSLDERVRIIQSDFTQKPLLIKIGDKVGSDYSGLENIVYAKQPSIEAFSRPWHSKDTHHIELQVRPDFAGKFVIFLKAIALPHTDNFSHYPQNGIKDSQNEFVKVYAIDVLN